MVASKPVRPRSLGSIKKTAKKLSKEKGIQLHEALDHIAREEGYDGFTHALHLMNAETPEKESRKPDFVDFKIAEFLDTMTFEETYLVQVKTSPDGEWKGLGDNSIVYAYQSKEQCEKVLSWLKENPFFSKEYPEFFREGLDPKWQKSARKPSNAARKLGEAALRLREEVSKITHAQMHTQDPYDGRRPQYLFLFRKSFVVEANYATEAGPGWFDRRDAKFDEIYKEPYAVIVLPVAHYPSRELVAEAFGTLLRDVSFDNGSFYEKALLLPIYDKAEINQVMKSLFEICPSIEVTHSFTVHDTYKAAV